MISDTKKLKILVIDDSKEVTSTISKFFQNFEFDTIVTNDSMTGLNCIRHENFDLILLDIDMPVISGLGIIELLAREDNLKNQNIFVFPENYITQSQLDNLLKREGIKGFLKKPINSDEILTIISSNTDKKIPRIDISN
jgi:CheY-like chemotaxis protein